MVEIKDLTESTESSIVVASLSNADLNDVHTIQNVVQKFAFIADKVLDRAASSPEHKTAALSLMSPLTRILKGMSSVDRRPLSNLKFSKYSDEIQKLLDAQDPSWIDMWAFAMNLAISCPKMTLNVLNQFLKHPEYAFVHLAKSQDENVVNQPYKAWAHAIDIFASNPNTLTPVKLIRLLLQPLKMYQSKIKIQTWLLIARQIGTAHPSHAKDIVQPFVEELVKPKRNGVELCRTFPDECCRSLVELMSLKQLRQSYVDSILSVFERVASPRCSSDAVTDLCAAFEDYVVESKDSRLIIEFVNILAKMSEQQPMMGEILNKFILKFDDSDLITALKAQDNCTNANVPGLKFFLNDSCRSIGSDRWLFSCRAYAAWLFNNSGSDSDFELLGRCLNEAQEKIPGLSKEYQKNVEIITEEVEKICLVKSEVKTKLKFKVQHEIVVDEDKSKKVRPGVKSTFLYRKAKAEEKNRPAGKISPSRFLQAGDVKTPPPPTGPVPLSDHGLLRENVEKILAVETDVVKKDAAPVDEAQLVLQNGCCGDGKENADIIMPPMAKKTPPVSPAAKTVKPAKKLTPSKCSYFEEDASDLVFIPPKPKTTPLTARQIEKRSHASPDIPALYQDLSQDTQTNSNYLKIEEVEERKRPSRSRSNRSRSCCVACSSTSVNSELVIIAPPAEPAPVAQLSNASDDTEGSLKSSIENVSPAFNSSSEQISATLGTPTSISTSEAKRPSRGSMSSAKKLDFESRNEIDETEAVNDKSVEGSQLPNDKKDSGGAVSITAKRTRRASSKLKENLEEQQLVKTIRRVSSPRPSTSVEKKMNGRKRRLALVLTPSPSEVAEEENSGDLKTSGHENSVNSNSEQDSDKPSATPDESPHSTNKKKHSAGRARGRPPKRPASTSACSLEAWLNKKSPSSGLSEELTADASLSPLSDATTKLNNSAAVELTAVSPTELSDDNDIELVIVSPKRRALSTVREETPCRHIVPSEIEVIDLKTEEREAEEENSMIDLDEINNRVSEDDKSVVTCLVEPSNPENPSGAIRIDVQSVSGESPPPVTDETEKNESQSSSPLETAAHPVSDSAGESNDDPAHNEIISLPVSLRPRRQRTMSLPVATRSSRIMNLAVAKSKEDEEEVGSSADSGTTTVDDEPCETPVRKRRKSIQKLPPVWPEGEGMVWSPCVPHEFASPSRGLLKRGDNVTPSPSPATKKRVSFMEPPVNRGLLYGTNGGPATGRVMEVDTPGEVSENAVCESVETIYPVESLLENAACESVETIYPVKSLPAPAPDTSSEEEKLVFDTWSQTDSIGLAEIGSQTEAFEPDQSVVRLTSIVERFVSNLSAGKRAELADVLRASADVIERLAAAKD